MQIKDLLGIKVDHRVVNAIQGNNSQVSTIKKTTCIGIAAIASFAAIPLAIATAVPAYIQLATRDASTTFKKDQLKALNYVNTQAYVIKYPYRFDRNKIRQEKAFERYKFSHLFAAKLKSISKIALKNVFLGPLALVSIIGIGAISGASKIFNKTFSTILVK